MSYHQKKSFVASYSAFFIVIILFRAMLDYVYVDFVNPVYGYDFLSFKINYDTDRYIASWLLFVPCLFFLNHRLQSFGDFFFSTAVLTLVAPLTTIYGMDAKQPAFPLLMTQMSLFIIYVMTRSRVFLVPKLPYFKNSRSMLIAVSWLLVGFLIFWFVVSGAVNNINFDPSKVYDFRLKNSEIVDVGFLAYLNLWIYKFFTIFLIAYCLYKKKYVMVAVLLCIQIFFYGVTAHKITFFLPLLAISVWFYFRRSNLLIIMPFAYLMVLVIADGIYAIWEVEEVAAMLIRRVFFVPAGMTFEWFDFFSTRPDVLWADRALAMFFENPYDKPLAFVVGTHLLSPELGANNGYISTGYAHAGVFGIIIYSLILGYVVKLFDVLARQGVPLWLVLSLTIGPLRTVMTDSDLLTTLISHGLLVALVIVVLFRTRQQARFYPQAQAPSAAPQSV